ncbi:MAG: hypothetical protein NVV66_17225 [Cellulomonas sp.]|uniref:hypothetical protein n=1 Tax=Cellulomonas sp. TaxID=40001 RepID=UPI0025872F8A|nr:hypothetical protein [Cellulomonas sp.]MCR6706348.1 hypothetical protein [Cellulomonas sp.]
MQPGDPLSEAEWLQDEGWFEESGLPAGQDLKDLDEVALEHLAADLSEVRCQRRTNRDPLVLGGFEGGFVQSSQR